MAIRGAVFNVLAITTQLLHGTPQEAKYVPIASGAFYSKTPIGENAGINHSYKIVDAHKRTYFLKEMSEQGLIDGDFSDDEDEESKENTCIKCPAKSHLEKNLPILPVKLDAHVPVPTETKKRFKPNLKVHVQAEPETSNKHSPKYLPLETIVENEVDSSRLAAFFTDGLVPNAEVFEDHRTIIQEYIELDREKTSKYFHSGKIDFKSWTYLEKEQFFTHMLADLVLKNIDAHFEQFGIDKHGNIIGFDKGKANLIDRHSASWESPFGIGALTIRDNIVYSGFIDYLTKHKEELKEIIHSDTVNKTFGRAETVASKLEENLHSPTFSVPQGEDPVKFKKFYNSYITRFKTLKSDTYAYFELH